MKRRLATFVAQIFPKMISINKLSYFLGDRALYTNMSWHIKPKDKIGLIGANGAGKSTILRLIMSIEIESKVKVEGLAVSKGARASIEKAGGSIVEIQETKTKNKEKGSE